VQVSWIFLGIGIYFCAEKLVDSVYRSWIMLELRSTMAGEVSSPELEIEVATVDGSSL
jgi:hypothetical protein